MPENSALHDAIHIHEEHNEKRKYFHETTTIENVLNSHIIWSLESVYIKELMNPSTETILYDISKIFTFLLNQYRQIEYEHLRQEQNKIKNFEYSITDPPILIFNAIEDLVSLSIAGKLPKSQQQIIIYALNIFKQTGELGKSLTTWYNLAPVDTTWHNFKTHVTNVYNNILKIKGKTIKIHLIYKQTRQFHNLQKNLHICVMKC